MIILSSLLSFCSPLFALSIPAEFGQVQEKTEGTLGRTLVLIQEAHADYGAQKSISEILKSLIEKESLHLVLVEGGWEDMSLTYLRDYAGPKDRKEVAESYLREGKISGEEYLDIATDLDFILWGIEAPKLYEKNMKAFLKFHEKQEKILAELAALEASWNAAAEKLFPPEFLELIKKKQAFEKHTLSLVEYVKVIAVIPAKAGIQSLDPPVKPGDDNLLEFPHLKALLDLSGIDEEKARLEKQRLIQALTRKVTKPELEQIQILQNPDTPEQEARFLRDLLGLAVQYPEVQKSVPLQNLTRTMRALNSSLTVDGGELFAELGKFEEKALSGFAASDDQKQLLAMMRTLEILRKLFELKLNPEEFDRIESEPLTLPSPQRGEGWGEGKVSFPDLKLLERSIPAAKDFYKAARKREKALIENALKKIEKDKAAVAAMIVGGFHKDHLVEAFKKRGYSVLVVSPRFTPSNSPDEGRRYFELLKLKWGNGPIDPKIRNPKPVRQKSRTDPPSLWRKIRNNTQ